MSKTAKWRGNPKATEPYEFKKLLDFLKPTKNDIFYDLGCGFGNTCKWISNSVKVAIGIEDRFDRYEIAVKNTLSIPNVKILHMDFTKVSLKDATIVYSTSLGLNDFARIQNEVKPHSYIVDASNYPVYFPLKAERIAKKFNVIRTPYERVNNEDVFAWNYLRKKNVTMRDLYGEIGRKQAKSLEWYISHSDYVWQKYFKN